MKHKKLYLLVVFFLASCTTPATLAPTQTFTPEPTMTQTPIPTATATITVTTTPTKIPWPLNVDGTLIPPQSEYDLIKETAKNFLTAFYNLEDIGSESTDYPALEEKGKLLGDTYSWAQSQYTYSKDIWFIGQYQSFDVRCFNEEMCEAAFLMHITGVLYFCEGIDFPEKGTCWRDPKGAGIWWDYSLAHTRNWYDRILTIKINGIWYATSYSSYPVYSDKATPTPWSPK